MKKIFLISILFCWGALSLRGWAQEEGDSQFLCGTWEVTSSLQGKELEAFEDFDFPKKITIQETHLFFDETLKPKTLSLVINHKKEDLIFVHKGKDFIAELPLPVRKDPFGFSKPVIEIILKFQNYTFGVRAKVRQIHATVNGGSDGGSNISPSFKKTWTYIFTSEDY